VAKKVRVMAIVGYSRAPRHRGSLITASGLLQEGVRVLAQLPLPSCPVADVALQQLLPRILGYLKKTLQVGLG
jgi:hypothetical protein